MIHISDIQNYLQCPIKYNFAISNKIKRFQFLSVCEKRCDILMRYFNDDKVFLGSAHDQNAKTIAASKRFHALCDARFEYNEVRIKIAYMQKNSSGWDVYFLFHSCFPNEREGFAIKLTCEILTKCGIPISNVFLLSLNPDYIRKEELDVHELLIKHQQLYRSKNKATMKIPRLLQTRPFPLEETVQKMRNMGKLKQPKMRIACMKNDKCDFFNNCFPLLPEKKLSFVISRDQVNSRIKYAQYISQSDEMFVDYCALQGWLKTKLKYPLIYLDFEWETYTYPPYHNMQPLNVIPFQFSMHIEQEAHKTLVHHQYLGEGDCREDFIITLLKDIPDQGSIFVFNKEGAEKLRLVQLSKQFPIYEKRLASIWERMVDIAIPFSSGIIYHKNMANQFSLKRLVEVFSNSQYSYHTLEIQEGLQAVEVYRSLKNLNESDKKKAIAQLYEYCSLDTFGEYILLHACIDAIKKRGLIR